MPAPATTGQLKTQIGSMGIGDYITCNYSAASGVVGTFSNLGGTLGTEIPISGTATPNGSFYLVKADKGLLIADRVIQNSIAWDTLNSRGYIQGSNTVINVYSDVVLYQTLSSGSRFNSKNSFIASTSSSQWQGANLIVARDEYSVIATGIVEIEYDAYLTGFYSSAPNHSFYLVDPNSSYVRDSQYGMYQYSAAPLRSSYSTSQPTIGVWHHFKHTINFTSKTHAVTVDGTTNNPSVNSFGSFIDGAKLNIEMGVASYSYAASNIYKNITIKNSTDTTAKQVLFSSENEMTIRSLTGGTAYADENGNMSTTNKSLGGWPTNNECDKYIYSFPLSFIATGMNLDDVFNTNRGILSWMRDTIALSLGTSTNRTVRANGRGFGWQVSNSVLSTVGFRPVFEYKEV